MNPRRSAGLLAVLSLVVAALTTGARAQQRSSQFFIEPLSDATGQVGLGLALRKLTTIGAFMHTTRTTPCSRCTRAARGCASRS